MKIKKKFLDFLNFYQAYNIEHTLDYYYGWHDKSLGFKIVTSTNQEQWVQICDHQKIKRAEFYNKRLQESNKINGLKKPKLLQASIIPYDLKFWSVVHMECVDDAFSLTPHLMPGSFIPSSWFIYLKETLSILAKQPSPFTAFRQEFIQRRIQERFPTLSVNLSLGCTVHGDVHWSNVTRNGFLLDWESWGYGPQHIDIAFLYLFSLLHKKAKEEIEHTFYDIFTTKEFKGCLLFGCCELMRMTELYNDYSSLYPSLEKLSYFLAKDLS